MQREPTFFIKVALGVILVALIVSLTIYATRDLSHGAELTLSYPTDGLRVTEPLIEITGSVSNASEVLLNGRKIFLTESGSFREKLLLLPGYNIMTITVEDRFKRQKVKRIQVVLDEAAKSPSIIQ